MTVLAVIAARDMRRMLARGKRTVVAGTAGANDLGVIHRVDGREHVGRVAILAHVRRQHVVLVLAGGVSAVMAAETVAGNVHVIEVGGQPGNRRVAVITVVAALNVIGTLAGSGYAVVARATGTDHLRVVNGVSRRPDAGRVAILTDIGC